VDDLSYPPINKLAAEHIEALRILGGLAPTANYQEADEALSGNDADDGVFMLQHTGSIRDQLDFISEGCRLACQDGEQLLATFSAGFVENFLKDKSTNGAAMVSFLDLAGRQPSVARSVAFVWIDLSDLVNHQVVGQTWISLIRRSIEEMARAGFADEIPGDWAPLLEGR
jgi:hypothetical protein